MTALYKRDELVDLVGQPITLGSYVAYARNQSDSATLRCAKIVKFSEKVDHYTYEKKYTIGVVPVEEDWKGGVWLGDRIVTLYYPERMVVLDPSRIREDFKTALDSWKEKV